MTEDDTSQLTAMKPSRSRSQFLSSISLRFIIRRSSHDGFTVPELLVAAIIAALLTAVTAQVMIGQLLEGRRLEAAQRVRENFSRLNYLIQIEASEAEEIVDGVSAPGCNGNRGFTLWVPRPTGIYADQANRSGISYFNQINADGQEVITRCGSPVSQNGQLEHGVANVTGEVVRGAQLDFDCDAAAVQGREISYEVNFTGGNFGADVGQCVVAHAKSIFVCNPPIDPLNPQIGDCQ